MKRYSVVIGMAIFFVLISTIGCTKKPEHKETVKPQKSSKTVMEKKEEKLQGPVFSMRKIVRGDDVFDRINGHSYKENKEVPLEDLRYLTISHYGFDGEIHVGEMIVNKDVARKVLAIFEKLYEAHYPIERMQLVDDFDADDTKSMEANNTSAFNYRKIAKSNQLSNHSYGRAIDINPLYNPYVYSYGGKLYVEPEKGQKYADRSKDFPYKIERDDVCFRVFSEFGFTWGGDFSNRKDYQHFEIRKP
ncbi:D-alanyl-D-alanine carboxypeptidase [Lachnospiraceae bacterium XBB1006]|nr:D-alanyl-D-alanine carboxypeptidase [Lachnospiraceae bacterium XBB1006]